ncbi:hypothetical protein [Burkholderia ambifaria]|nr:hypothetical protein [Burkholderia ambifaria]WDR87282.1 hypothetical protein OR986_01255 [Burkholderia ambifaria]WDR99974.1 hypothetical protein OR985_06205 [Burkholderia ambifaria]
MEFAHGIYPALTPMGRKIAERVDPPNPKRIFNILQIAFESGVA